MAATIMLSCPHCKKTLKASAELKGKKVRCKGCGKTFPAVESKDGAKASDAKKQSTAAKPGAGADGDDDEWSEAKAYGVNIEADVARCPFCAVELRNETDIICLNCGYNLQTRNRVPTKILEEITPMDRFMWLLPGIGYASAVAIMLGITIWMWVAFPFDWDDPTWAQTYVTVACGFGIYLNGMLAYRRLVVNPNPPEREKRDVGKI